MWSKKYAPPIGVLFGLLILWELFVRLFEVQKFILPAPSKIAEALVTTLPLLWEHSEYTLSEALLGFCLAIAAGLFLAVLMSLLPAIKDTFYPLVVVTQTIPIMALAPLLIIWFGYGILPKVMVVALVCFFPITVSLVEGLAAIDTDMVKLLQAMNATKWQILKKVQFPAALPSFFSGLKISATYSIMGAVIGEWLGASRGLGIYMTRSMHSFQTEQVFAAIIVISVLSLLLFMLVEAAGRLIMPWYYQPIARDEITENTNRS